MNHRWILAAVLATHVMAPAGAQTVYESKDKAGPVFSDRPSAGAAPVQLQTPNVVSAPAAKAPTPPASAAAAPPPYRRFVIDRPAAQDTVHSNTGEFAVSATLAPPLRASDRVRVLLDGNLLNGVYRSTGVRIGASDWSWAAAGTNSEHSVQLVVVDAAGKPLMETPAVAFYVRRAAVGGKRH